MPRPLLLPFLAGLALLVLLGAPATVRADEPWLAVRLAGGESACYPVGQIDRVGFEGDTLVIVSTLGPERWGADQIRKIEFLFDPQSSSTPRDVAALVKAMRLFQNQPNPFSPETRIAFELARAGMAEMRIYGPDGRLIRTLLKELREVGRHTVTWNGRDDSGNKVGAGVYLYQLIAPGCEESRRMILLP